MKTQTKQNDGQNENLNPFAKQLLANCDHEVKVLIEREQKLMEEVKAEEELKTKMEELKEKNPDWECEELTDHFTWDNNKQLEEETIKQKYGLSSDELLELAERVIQEGQ